MKRSLYLALALIMVFGMAVTAAPSAPAKAQDAQTLELYLVGLPQDGIDWFNNVAFPAFEADHPGVKVELLNGDWGSFDTTVAGWITTGEGPDIIYLGSEYAATYCDLLTDVTLSCRLGPTRQLPACRSRNRDLQRPHARLAPADEPSPDLLPHRPRCGSRQLLRSADLR